MKKQIFIASLALAVAACGGSQNPNSNNDGNNNADSVKSNISTTSAQSVSKSKTVNWKKVLCTIDDHGDTMMLNIYDDKNRITKSLENIENGVAECETVYKYNGNKATVTYSCEEGLEDEITYADDKCEKIIEKSGQSYQYDSQDRISKIVIGNNEITYTYETDPKTGNTIVSIDDAGVIHEEHRDKLVKSTILTHTALHTNITTITPSPPSKTPSLPKTRTAFPILTKPTRILGNTWSIS